MKTLTLFGVIVLLCASCTVTTTKQTAGTGSVDRHGARSANEVYSRGETAVRVADYAGAVAQFAEFIRRFPADSRHGHALLGKGYADYKLGNSDTAVDSANTFIQSYKIHPLRDYAFYLRGLARYSEGIERLQNNEPVSNNRAVMAREAFDSFSQLVRNYPNSQYHEDSRIRMEVLFNKLAEHELAQAKNALEQEKSGDAIARAEYIIKHYMRTDAAREAYAVMINAFEAQGDLLTANSLRKKFAQELTEHQPADSGQGS